MSDAPMIKFSAPDWCFFEASLPARDYYGALVQMGITGAEMVPEDRWENARAAGLELLNLIGPGMEDGFNQAANHDRLLPELREAIVKAGANDIPHVIVFSGNRRGQGNAEGIANCARAFAQVLPDAEAAGVVLTFEMLNSYNHADYQADSVDYGVNLARKLNSPNFRLIYDVYHMARMGQPGWKPIVDNLEWIAHLHVAGSPTRSFPGYSQEIDYRDIVKHVRKAGYDGYWGFEFCARDDKLDELEKAVRLFQGWMD